MVARDAPAIGRASVPMVIGYDHRLRNEVRTANPNGI